MILHRFTEGVFPLEEVRAAVHQSGRIDGMNLLVQELIIALTRDFIWARGPARLLPNGHGVHILEEQDLDSAIEFIQGELAGYI